MTYGNSTFSCCFLTTASAVILRLYNISVTISCDLISCVQETGFPFTDCDVATFEAFAIFCGLGIHNTQMYESACEYRRLISVGQWRIQEGRCLRGGDMTTLRLVIVIFKLFSYCKYTNISIELLLFFSIHMICNFMNVPIGRLWCLFLIFFFFYNKYTYLNLNII